MPVSVAEFLDSVCRSGVLSTDAVATYASGAPTGDDAAGVAKRLVKDGLLTPLQAKYVYAGKAEALVLGPYVVLDILGKGGMGFVYKAEHRRMRRVVALKVIAKSALQSEMAIRRFEREVHAAARLEHPNIVTAHDAGEAAGTHYLVMQFVDGRNLSEVVKDMGPQPVGRAVDWILQAARGLAYAHDRGVVHRDIKPANLLLDGDGTVKILDMGLARLESLDADQDQLTGTGQIMGTVDYMAPEQAVDLRRADARSDIYALGVTLWYLLTGRPLFEADSVVQKIMAHQQKAPPPLPLARDDVTPEIDVVFQRMVAKEPEDRFQSMQEVIAALEGVPREDDSGPPSILLGGRDASLGPLAADATRTIARPRSTAATETTATLDAVAIDTNPGIAPVARGGLRGAAHGRTPLDPVRLTLIASGVVVLTVVTTVGLLFGGRRPARPPGGGIAQERQVERQEPSRDTAPPDARPLETAAAVSPPAGVRPAERPGSKAPPPAVAPFDATQARKHQEAWAKHLGIPVETTNSIGQTLVVIPPGRFMMGEFQKTVDVSLTKPFLLGQTEVTNAEWKAVMGAEPPSGWKDAGRPVENVNWTKAVEFCRKLSEQPEERRAGREYRLPTEAEWECACRAGTVTGFSFGDDESRLGDYAWFDRNSGSQTHPVGQKKPNAWGLFDMHGNVWEWCSDWQGDYGSGAVTDPQGPSGGPGRLSRGGSWNDTARLCRSAYRLGVGPSDRGRFLGFRLALSPSGSITPQAADTVAATPSPTLPVPALSPASPSPAVAPFDAAQARKHQEAWAKHLGIEVETTNSIGQTLVVIPPGRFTMGEGDQAVDVTLTKPCLLGQTEVTQGQWREVMGTEPWKGQQYTIEGTDVAAAHMSWDEAVFFCAKLTEQERGSGTITREQAYRLPTEAEWEFACRAGTVTAYSFGDNASVLGDYAWYGEGWRDGPIPGGNTAQEMYVHAVRLKNPNPFGLFDVHGNVWEWCSDWHGDSTSGAMTDPQGPSTASFRVIRSGCWDVSATRCRSSHRHRWDPSRRSGTVGFRLALSPPVSGIIAAAATTE